MTLPKRFEQGVRETEKMFRVAYMRECAALGDADAARELLSYDLVGQYFLDRYDAMTGRNTNQRDVPLK